MTESQSPEPSGADVIPFPTASLPAASSNEAVLSALYSQLGSKLTNYAAHYVSADEADDIVQQVFVHLWQVHLSADQKPKASDESILFELVRFRVMDYRRDEARRFAVLDVGRYAAYLKSLARSWMDPQAEVETDDFNKAIQKSLDHMSPRVREVQAMYRKAGFSVDEIAATTGLARETVRALLQRGNRILRDRLDRAGYSPESRRSDSGRSLKS